MAKKKKQTIATGCISKYIERLSQIKIKEGHFRIYRGESSLTYKPIPSIFRKDYIHLLKHEYDILKEVQILHSDLFRECNSYFDLLVKSQHYGIPTRLLDVTTNPLVALFFACNRNNDKKEKGNAKITIYDIPRDLVFYNDEPTVEYIVNESIQTSTTKRIGDSLVETKKSIMSKSTMRHKNISKNNENVVICVKTKLNNPRIIKQSGAFFLFGGDTIMDNYKILEKNTIIEISKSHLKPLLKDLNLLGISYSSLFPEIQSFATDLKDNKLFF